MIAIFAQMSVIIIVSAIISVCYVALIGSFWRGFCKVKNQPRQVSTPICISMVLPFHNEADNIGNCIKSLLNQQFNNHYEIIAVDDNSTDNSVEILSKYTDDNQHLHIIKSSLSGKKNAIIAGLQTAKYNYVATVDADCFYPPQWLQCMADEFADCWLLCAPVKIANTKKWFNWFQYIDFASLVGSGIGAAGCGKPIMCNGANMIFNKQIVNQIDNPFNTSELSGDDVFLLHSIKRINRQKIRFTCNHNTIAETLSADGFRAFIRQRIRWGSKTPAYTDADSLATAFIVACTSVATIGTLPLLPLSVLPFAIVYTSKTIIDILILNTICKEFGNRRLLWQLPVFELITVSYTTIVIISTIFKSNKQWK